MDGPGSPLKAVPAWLRNHSQIKNSAESENMTWILANTKPCPKCTYVVTLPCQWCCLTCSTCGQAVQRVARLGGWLGIAAASPCWSRLLHPPAGGPSRRTRAACT